MVKIFLISQFPRFRSLFKSASMKMLTIYENFPESRWCSLFAMVLF